MNRASVEAAREGGDAMVCVEAGSKEESFSRSEKKLKVTESSNMTELPILAFVTPAGS